MPPVWATQTPGFPDVVPLEVYEQTQATAGQQPEQGKHGLVQKAAPDANAEDIVEPFGADGFDGLRGFRRLRIAQLGAVERIFIIVSRRARIHDRLDDRHVAVPQGGELERLRVQIRVGGEDLARGLAGWSVLLRSRPVGQKVDVSLQVRGGVGVDGMVADQLDKQPGAEPGGADILVALAAGSFPLCEVFLPRPR